MLRPVTGETGTQDRKKRNPKHEYLNPKQYLNYKFKKSSVEASFAIRILGISICLDFRYSDFEFGERGLFHTYINNRDSE